MNHPTLIPLPEIQAFAAIFLLLMVESAMSSVANEAEDEQSSLIDAINAGNAEKVEALLNAGADVLVYGSNVLTSSAK